MGADYDDPNRLKFSNDEFYLKSREEMVRALPADIDAIDNTLEVAENAISVSFTGIICSRITSRYGDDPETYIRKLIDEGIKRNTARKRRRFATVSKANSRSSKSRDSSNTSLSCGTT
ncbi:MAG: hypothetical protein ACLUSP_10820 [Christensenellales bacterium]